MSDLSSKLRERAYRIRRFALRIGEAQGHRAPLAERLVRLPMCCEPGAAQQRVCMHVAAA